MPQRWICKTTGTMFLVKKQEANPAIKEELEASRNVASQEKAKTLLGSKASQNPDLN